MNLVYLLKYGELVSKNNNSHFFYFFVVLICKIYKKCRTKFIMKITDRNEWPVVAPLAKSSLLTYLLSIAYLLHHFFGNLILFKLNESDNVIRLVSRNFDLCSYNSKILF